MLQNAIESILNQDEEVEIIVSDNASTDGTKEYMEGIKAQNQKIKYFRWQETVACGENLLNVVNLASEGYCWLLSDDDQLQEGSLSKVKKILEEYPDLTGLSVNVEGFDVHLSKRKKLRYSHRLKKSVHFSSFKVCYKELGAWFGFWSAQIIKKEKWMQALSCKEHEKYLGYHHLYLICKMIKKDPSWYFLADKCVGYRADNESFSKEYGRLKRYEIDLVTYQKVGRDFFGRSKEERAVCRKVLNAYSFWQIVAMKLHNTKKEELLAVLKASFHHYKSYPEFWVKLLPLFLIPRTLLLSLQKLYRRLR